MFEHLRLLAYNLPMFFIFVVLAADLLWRAWRLGLGSFLNAHGGTVLVWAIGFVILYFRLVEKSLVASGHMSWLPMLTVQAYLYGFPRWFVGFSAAFTMLCLLLKLTVMGARSGIEGTAIGLILATLLWFSFHTEQF